ncbi:MAG: hypothetical protein KI790_21290, partial [Cyclobacteriaceae bacterium]|nr:hypothetical protein [Cyclobacteriaceae bacterium HetDA_MAG_MS6]
PLTIGSDYHLVEFFKGTLDEVMLFDRALTQEEVKQLYRQ